MQFRVQGTLKPEARLKTLSILREGELEINTYVIPSLPCSPDRRWPSILDLSGFLINSPLISAFIICNDKCILSIPRQLLKSSVIRAIKTCNFLHSKQIERLLGI